MTSSRPRPARWALLAAAVLFWAVVVALGPGVGIAPADAVMVAVLLVVVPGLAVAQMPLARLREIERIPAYWGSIVSLWLLGSAAWLVGTRAGDGTAVGLTPIPVGAALAWTLALLGGTLLIVLGFHALARLTGTSDTPLLRALLPESAREKQVFALLSVAAGVFEEIAYRGYLILVLAPVTGLLVASVVSSAAFGVVHAYQGWIGVARTGLMGGLLAWGFLASGSLWPAVLAHTAIDLLAGSRLGRLLLSPEPSDGVGSPEHAPHSELPQHPS